MSIGDFKKKINDLYKGDVIRIGDSEESGLNVRRFSSTILSCDLAYGGGLPFGRIIIDAGAESTGKTYKAIKACVSVQEYDHATRKHKDFIGEGEKFSADRALFVDMEGSWDMEWGKKLGFDPAHHVLAQPEYAEQAIDIVNYAVRENIFDLIVVDSIAALIPSKELEDSAEDWQIGLQARLVNKAMRKWIGSLNKLNQTHLYKDPTIYYLNQFKINIGMMFGDPRTLPTGQAQKFAASIISYTKSAKTDETDAKEAEFVKMGGVCKKNKTFPPKKNYEFSMRLRANADHPQGHVDNTKTLFDEGKRLKLIKKVAGGLQFGKVMVPTEKDVRARLNVSEVLP